MKTLHIFLFSILLAIFLAACSQKAPTPEEVAQKIDTKEVLTTADYTTMIDYCGEYAKKAQPYFDIVNAEQTDSTRAAIDATNALANLYGEYKYLDAFRGKIEQTDLTKLGADNEKKVMELAQYEGFPLPLGSAPALINKDEVGVIEEMPATDSDGVIATGAGEAVNIQTK